MVELFDIDMSRYYTSCRHENSKHDHLNYCEKNNKKKTKKKKKQETKTKQTTTTKKKKTKKTSRSISRQEMRKQCNLNYWSIDTSVFVRHDRKKRDDKSR